MLVRKAKSNDLDSITEFQRVMARETENIELEHSTVYRGVSAVLEDATKGQYYVAEKDGKVIGSLLTTFEWSDWRNGTVLWIQSVYVVPEFRRTGVYSSLYAHVKNRVLHNPDLKGIRLYADKSNEAAQKVYRKLGMTPDHYLTFEWLK
ncbi:GNAT family N-acetyltransferase [Mariniphaga sediminis]|jgi:GNAT superfamily N-acetyltransferase|uniref:GNAT family N-acetyltransferase n=1 Tax=Mariniphaga sediminis TaxID=1628158 RepID=A0A399D832_9BACT|nr:GNAT family N-acetyltransferase [Mariniphaga sediminis]RIH66721.1 GNAT family N-acetyltransferase [Mariniphaga sediminis]